MVARIRALSRGSMIDFVATAGPGGLGEIAHCSLPRRWPWRRTRAELVPSLNHSTMNDSHANGLLMNDWQRAIGSGGRIACTEKPRGRRGRLEQVVAPPAIQAVGWRAVRSGEFSVSALQVTSRAACEAPIGV